MNRRDFIQSTSSTAFSTLVLPSFLHNLQDPIKLAIVGTGWWGTDFLLKNVLVSGLYEVVGLCDVDAAAMDNAANKVVAAGGKKPQLFSDYKAMYKMPGLQAVIIATPPHWHALHFIDACKAGLHVFLEKPISYDIREGQAMLEAHRKANNVVMVDFPRAMLDTNQKVKDFIKSGEAGKILQVQANIYNPEGNLVEKPIPTNFDFETYCGPAPRNKFMCSGNANKPNWRGMHDFSRGIMVDWGIHYLNNVRRVMDLDLPEKVWATGGIVKLTGQENPDHLDVRFDFGNLPVYWTHKTWGYNSPTPEHNIGVYYFGEKATIFAGDAGWEVFAANSKDKVTRFAAEGTPGDQAALMFQRLFTEFANGVRNKSNAGITNTLEDAFKTTSMVIYGDLAYQVKAPLAIDTKMMNIQNNKAAQALLKRKYRAPYQHPFNG
ncbi:MAG: Gfo/Idh/MocA family protein [Saprospiraceae bacterium]